MLLQMNNWGMNINYMTSDYKRNLNTVAQMEQRHLWTLPKYVKIILTISQIISSKWNLLSNVHLYREARLSDQSCIRKLFFAIVTPGFVSRTMFSYNFARCYSILSWLLLMSCLLLLFAFIVCLDVIISVWQSGSRFF